MRLSTRPRRGFTLVELLVVIGILALLVSILLPSLNRARELSNQTVCLSNLRQLGTALFSYTRDNEEYFPFKASISEIKQEDWVHWQPSRPVRKSPIAPYLGANFNTNILKCPSDDPARRPRKLTPDDYQYSYTMNGILSSRPAPDHPDQPVRVTNIRNTSEKILLVEEDARTVDDGHWHARIAATDPLVNNLATRHDQDFQGADGRGNAAFADGHAEYVSRNFCYDPRHYEPKR